MTGEDVGISESWQHFGWLCCISYLDDKSVWALSPYEKNLEVWRQLWRVVERSDLVLFILDARNPLVFRCADFELYVRGTRNAAGEPKEVMYLLNKADLLTAAQRRAWAAYFTARGESFVFFSARPTATETGVNNDTKDTEAKGTDDEEDDDEEEEEEEEVMEVAEVSHRPKRRGGRKALRAPIALAHPYELSQRRRAGTDDNNNNNKKKKTSASPAPPTAEEAARDARAAHGSVLHRDTAAVVNAMELLDVLAARRGALSLGAPLLVGLVGYPNVGKSSTINAILGAKRVVVSATPGKTRHLQTLAIPQERRVALCDCPGLVFPSFASTRAQMLCDGVLPVDTSVDAAAAVTVVCRRVPRGVLETRFRVTLSGAEAHLPAAEQLLAAVAERRGYLSSHGRVDRGRAARDILRMYVEGGIVYAEPPPGDHTEQTERKQYTNPEEKEKEKEKEEEEEEVDEEEWEDIEDAEAWDDLESAEDARALSDAGDTEYVSNDHKGKRALSPLFFDRARGPMTREEAFNAEANIACMETVEEAPKRHRRTNHQIEPDYETFINAEGEVELCIDDDDGILQLDMPVATYSTEANEESKKQKSKRQMRREEKRNGGALHGNPTARRVGVLGYGNP